MSKEYLLDTCIVLEILHGNEKTVLWVNELNKDEDKIMLSGWTILELIKEKDQRLKWKTAYENY